VLVVSPVDELDPELPLDVPSSKPPVLVDDARPSSLESTLVVACPVSDDDVIGPCEVPLALPEVSLVASDCEGVPHPRHTDAIAHPQNRSVTER
jgi:hypothetical protein